jgi:hypothetical protein
MALMDQIKSIASIGKQVAGSNETVVLPPSKSKFDKYMNKINRLPRIMMLVGIIAMIIHAALDPVHYTLWMKALQETPAELWYLFTIVIVSWAGTKFVRDIKMPSDANVIQLNTGPVINAGDVMTGTERMFDNLEHDDDDINELPPENEAIEEWKKNR